MFNMMGKIPLQYKIMLLTISMVCFVLVAAGILVIRDIVDQVEDSVSKRALDIARIIAQVPSVQEAITSDATPGTLQPFAERWRVATGAAFIVIANMDQIRLSHPIAENVGMPISDLYREPVLEGQEYVYVGKGTLATSLRANVPIFATDGVTQIGFVSVGFYLDDMYKMALASTKQVLYGLLVALALSVAGASYLARDIKKAIFGLEPYEIATILKERTATFEAVREGIVAVDVYGGIRMLNSEAAAIFGITPEQAAGRHIASVLPHNRLSEVISSGQALYDEEQRVQDSVILANSVPIVVDDKVVGAVISFRDRTEIHRLAEEITGVHRFVDVMRAQAHEYKNKLHTIAGLIQLGRNEEAVNYIVDSGAADQSLFEQLRSTVCDSLVFGLLLGKSSRAKELGIYFVVTPDSTLTGLPRNVSSSDMVLIIGNLIENAMEAVAGSASKEVEIGLYEVESGLRIIVKNSGPWIDAQLGDTIYKRGVTTKRGNRGYGLALVADKVSMKGGTVKHSNEAAGGVVFEVYIPNEA